MEIFPFIKLMHIDDIVEIVEKEISLLTNPSIPGILLYLFTNNKF